MRIMPILAATAAIGAIATPALAQSPYPYSHPQQGYQYPAPQQGYAYPQQQGGVAGIINQLLGNRYAQNDRTAVTRCATAAQVQAARQYRPANAAYGQPPYGNAYGYYGQAPGHSMARVTGITNVEQRRNGLRVTGTMASGMAMAHGQPAYGQPGYGHPAYSNQGYHPAYGAQAMSDLSFRCTVDYRGAITNLKVSRNNQYRTGQYNRGW